MSVDSRTVWETVPPSGPDLPPYDAVRRAFSWDTARAELAGLPDGSGLNIAHEAVDRHVAEGRGDVVAIRVVAEGGAVSETTYAQLRQATNRFANVLVGLGIGKGDRVMSLLGRQREQYVTALGTLKCTAVFSPLFSSFGPEPIRERLRLSRARVLVTTASLYRRKVAKLRADLPDLEHVLIVDGSGDVSTWGLEELMAARVTGVRDPAHRSRGHGPAPLHQRDDREAQGSGARPPGRGGPPRDLGVRPRPPARRRLLVHRRPGLGHRDVVRHHRAAHPRGDADQLRGRVRGGHVVRRARRAPGHRLVHRTDRPPDAREVRRGPGPRVRPRRAAAHRQRRRGAEPRGRGVGARGLRAARPRQLVADRDRRDHGQQLPRHGGPPGVDGPADARDRGRRPRARCRRPGPDRGGQRHRRGDRRDRRAGPPSGLAVDVPRLPRRRAALPGLLRRWLVPQR